MPRCSQIIKTSCILCDCSYTLPYIWNRQVGFYPPLSVYKPQNCYLCIWIMLQVYPKLLSRRHFPMPSRFLRWEHIAKHFHRTDGRLATCANLCHFFLTCGQNSPFQRSPLRCPRQGQKPRRCLKAGTSPSAAARRSFIKKAKFSKCSYLFQFWRRLCSSQTRKGWGRRSVKFVFWSVSLSFGTKEWWLRKEGADTVTALPGSWAQSRAVRNQQAGLKQDKIQFMAQRSFLPSSQIPWPIFCKKKKIQS